MRTESPSRPDTHDPLQLLLDGWRAVVRYRVRAIAFFVITVGVVVAATLALPKTYESRAKLLVKIGRESVTLDPTATIGQTLSVYDSRETEINSVLEILGSRAVIEQVVDALGSAVILQKVESGTSAENAAVPETEFHDAENLVAAAPAVSDREKAVAELMEMTAVAREKKSNVLSVTAKSYTPALAQRIVAELLEAFRGRYLDVHSTAGSYEFFVEQESLLAGELREATGDLGRARNELDMGTVEGQRKAIQDHLASLATLRATAIAELKASNDRITSLEKTLVDLPAQFVSQRVTGFAEDAAGRTRTRLNELRLREERLLTALLPQNTRVLAVREEIEAAERLLAENAQRETQTTTVANPARQQLELALLTERSNAAALEGRVGSLDAQRADVHGSLRRLNEQEGRIADLVGRVERLRTDHRNYATKLEQARVSRELARERISNVAVWQQPTFVAKAVGPKRRLIAGAGFVVAFLGAIGLAIASEFLSRWRRARDEEPEAEVVVPATTPEAPSGSTLRTRLASTMTH